MKSLGFIATVVIAGMASAGAPSTAQATQICDQQYQQCLNDGIYPIYKCEQLRLLCEDVYGFQSAPPTLFDGSKLAWMSNAASAASK